MLPTFHSRSQRQQQKTEYSEYFYQHTRKDQSGVTIVAICCLLYDIAMCVGGRDNHLESFQVFIYLKKALQFNLAGRRGRLERVLENEKARRWDCLPMHGIIQDV